MENVPMSLKGFMEKQLKTSGNSKLDIVDVAPMFIQLGLLLKDLHDAYGFYHRDLHAGNIMFNGDGALNIIDFGKACLVVNGVTYALPGSGSCRSWDLLILLTYLIQYSSQMFHNSVILMFRDLLTSTNNIDFYTYALQVGSREYIPAFHAVYPDYIRQLWRDEERDALLHNSPYLEPANFVQLMLDQIDSKSGQRSSLVRQSPQRNLYISPEKIGGLYRMAKKNSRKSNRKNRSTRRNMRKNRSGGGYQTSQQMFDPEVLPPTTVLAAPSTAPTSSEIRPVLLSTFQSAGGRKTRRRGGFSPSVMGGFVANAQSAIVPLALYAVYHTMVPKKGPATLGGLFKNMTRKNRRNSRK
jgi:serine/threonine protein kinase